jgi:diguanylate cyclase (GGDEF)-like protein/PAS domain S-box-containing protein
MADTAGYRDRIPGGVLLIGGDPVQAKTILTAISGDGQPPVEWTPSLAEGLARLRQPGVTSILLSLQLPDSAGIDSFERTAEAAGQTPIVVVCRVSEESTGRLAVERGAADFLLEDQLNRESVTRAFASLHDRRIAAAVFKDKERAELTLNAIGDGVLCTDTAGKVTYLNAVAEAMTGWSRADADGRPLEDVFNIIDGSTRQLAQNPLAVAIWQDRTVALTENCVLVRRDGYESAIEDSAAPIHDRQGRVIGAVIVFHDVSAARRISLQLSHLAQHDFLTDLPNRLLIKDRLQQAVSVARRHTRRIAVLFVDLDRFKQVNDSLGHLVGDQLLKDVAQRLTGVVRQSDTVGRQGGDEFVVVLSDVELPESADATAAKLLEAIALPYHIGGHSLRVSASIGISIYPDDADDAETLLSCADSAMYQAKNNGSSFAYRNSRANQPGLLRP